MSSLLVSIQTAERNHVNMIRDNPCLGSGTAPISLTLDFSQNGVMVESTNENSDASDRQVAHPAYDSRSVDRTLIVYILNSVYLTYHTILL